MDLVKQPLGAEGDLKLVLEAGKVKLAVVHASKGAEVSLGVAVDSKYFVEKLKAAIPGPYDDMIFDALLALMPK